MPTYWFELAPPSQTSSLEERNINTSQCCKENNPIKVRPVRQLFCAPCVSDIASKLINIKHLIWCYVSADEGEMLTHFFTFYVGSLCRCSSNDKLLLECQVVRGAFGVCAEITFSLWALWVWCVRNWDSCNSFVFVIEMMSNPPLCSPSNMWLNIWLLPR